MKKSVIVVFMLLMLLVAVNTSAAVFTDVPDGEWYSEPVNASYEAGLFSGTGSGMFSPRDGMTVAEAVTVAARLNAAYNGEKIISQDSDENWYDSYISYAEKAGIISADSFDDYNRNIKRWEVAGIFSKCVPESYLAAKNDISEIPDVPETNSYYENVQLLYNAGIMMGRDEYGTFAPLEDITRAEAATVFSRIAFPDTRLEKTLTDANYGDAYFLLHQRGSTTFSKTAAPYDSAWNYDNRNRVGVISNSANQVYDSFTDGEVVLWHDLEDVSDGLLGWDFFFEMGKLNDGLYFSFCDDNKNNVFSLHVKNGNFYFNDTDTGIKATDGSHYVNVRADLDKRTAELYIAGKRIGNVYNINKGTVSRFYIGSPEETVASVTITRCDVYKDYVINERFFVPYASELAEWNVTGSGTVVTANGQAYGDHRSGKLTAGSVASKSFGKISGDVVLEIYMLFPTATDTGYVSLNSGDKTVARINVNADGVFKADGTKLRHHTNNIWQCLRIEADTVTGKAVYRVNGKKIGEFAFDNYASFVDNVTVGATSGSVIFDDVKVFLTHEYEDYCPEPVPVTDDGYDVILNMCSLWLEGGHFGWSSVSGYPDVEPALGYYDEGIVEVADWEIKFMVENGIDVQHLCWYSPSGDITDPIKRSSHNEALHDGFFNSKYSDMMKFTFMWENSGVNCSSLEQFRTYIWNYWMDYYFLDDRFYTIDNKIVFTVWSYGNFKKAFGGTVEGCLEAVEFMNTDAKAHGFEGVMIFFADGHKTDATTFANMASMGGTAAYAYHWQQDGIYANKTIPRLQKNQDYGEIHIVPTVSVGFNNIGWSGERKPMASLEDHKTVLEYIKNDYLPEAEGWKSKTLVVSTWNEYGEGTYVMPAKGLHGFGYLDNVRKVISGVEAQPNNIFPTEQQKARLGHIYPKSKTSLAKLDYDYYGDVIYSITGDNVAVGQYISGSVKNGVFVGTSTHNDPYLIIKSAYNPYIEADKIKAIRIVVKSDVECAGEIHFQTVENPSWSWTRWIGYQNRISDDLVEYIIPTYDVANWEGTIKTLRFDVLTTEGNFEFAKCEFLGYSEEKTPLEITVDGSKYAPCWDAWEENGEIYCPAEPITGFFSLNNFYYEWSRFTNKLYILTKNGNEFEFEVGSSTAKFNGTNFSLSKEVELIDGLPVLPLKFIYDKDGIEYTVDGNAVTVSIADEKYVEAIKNRVPNRYEFEVAGDSEGITGYGTTLFVYDGALRGHATPLYDGTREYYDAMYTLDKLTVDTDVYRKIAIGMSHELVSGTSNHIRVYFKQADTALSEKRVVVAEISGKSSDGEYIEYVLDMSSNENWTGTVTGIRVDPVSGEGAYAIDYIRFIEQ